MGSDDWQRNKPQAECMKYMLDNQMNCDINFRIGEDPENIKANKMILSLRSAVFERMFHGNFRESKRDPVIPDVTAPAFQALLRYCYYECVDIEGDVALDVLYAAQKYMLPLLEEAARKKLVKELSLTNIWDIYRYAINIGDIALSDACKMYFTRDVTPVRKALQTQAFLNIPHEVLLDFLDTKSNYNVPLSDDKAKAGDYAQYKNDVGISIPEIELFRACDAWAEAECLRQEIDPTGANKRTVLGECLFLIRFPTMLLKDLMTVVCPTRILKQAEIVKLCQFQNKDPDSEKSPVDFPSKERQVVATTQKISRNGAKKSVVLVKSAVRVMLSRVWVTGPGCYKVTVRDEKADSSCSVNYNTTHQNHCTKEIFEKQHVLYMLDIKPQLLEPSTQYSITADRLMPSRPADPKLIPKWIVMADLSPFKEVKLIVETHINSIHAITLCLV